MRALCVHTCFRPVPELDPARYSIPETGKTYNLTGIIHIGVKGDPSMPRDKAPIELILKHLKRTYCGKIAYEFRHIPVGRFMLLF